MLAIDGAIVRADVTIYRRAFCKIGRISENQFSWIVIRNIVKFQYVHSNCVANSYNTVHYG